MVTLVFIGGLVAVVLLDFLVMRRLDRGYKNRTDDSGEEG